MKLLLLLCACATLVCGCDRPQGLEHVQPRVGLVEGVEYRVVSLHMPRDTSGYERFYLRLRNTNAYAVDVYLFDGVQAGDTIAVSQSTFVSVPFPICVRLAPGEVRTQEFTAATQRPEPIRLTGWHVLRLDSLSAPSTRERMLGHWRLHH